MGINNYFITGIDTNIGKTIVSAWVCLHTNKKYWKPIQTGACDDRDSSFVGHIIGSENVLPEGYLFNQPASPHIAAKNAGTVVDRTVITQVVRGISNTVIEGAGGIMVPWSTNPNYTYLDFVAEMSLPTIIVASTRLGAINHTLLSIMALRSRNIDVRYLVINGGHDGDMIDTILSFYPSITIEVMPHLHTITRESLLDVKCCIA